MAKALYRKYRSKNLSEIVGQEHITTALQNALKNGRISHAYLFTGPKGVGKTSIARILAHEVNQLPYDEDATTLDIIEIDAASNRRIDEIRELRERVHNAPAAAKYKVYIIDEVHMLTREAFNALLKTLEEPPAHAIFILATTEAHKLPDTIVSRTQRYTFRPIELDKAVNHLRMIAGQEKIDVTDEALELIAQHGDGSFRDSISLLDQVRHTTEQVTLETVQQTLGIASSEAIRRIISALESRDPAAILNEIKTIQEHGYHAPQIAKQLAAHLRADLLAGDQRLPKNTSARLLRELLDVPASHDPMRLLEIILLEATLPMSQSSPDPAPSTSDITPAASPSSSKPQKLSPNKAAENVGTKPAAADTPTKPPSVTTKTKDEKQADKKAEKKQATPLNEDSWQEILQAIKAKHNTLYSVARMAVPAFNGQEITLAFSFPFHQKRLNEAKNRQVIVDIIEQTIGQRVSLSCIVDPEARTIPAAITQPATPDPGLENISNIFGGGEVLE